MKWKENKPALKFLGLFLGVYLIGNVLYGLFIEWNYPASDAITNIVSHQSSWLINQWRGHETMALQSSTGPIVLIVENSNTILRIFEGCNGINVMIVFVAFIIAFGGVSKQGALFMMCGVIAIHMANLLRIALLFWVAKNHEMYFYYIHKYVFTAALYVIVLLLWLVWVSRIRKVKISAVHAA